MNNDKRRLHAQSLLDYERSWRNSGTVAGMDEVGRGPLAGPVVTACVIIPDTPLLIWVDDSKKLSESRRERLYDEIISSASAYSFGQVEAEEIDSVNILEATKKAMREAASRVPADFYLIDAVSGLGLPGREVPIIKGDAASYSIAAASVIAKVRRDRLMREMDELYPGYGFARNKGYGTAEHIAALKKLGPCPIHRKSFIGKILEGNL